MICMSGVTFSPWGFDVPSRIVARAERLGALLGTYTKDRTALLRAFYEASVEDLVTATGLVNVVTENSSRSSFKVKVTAGRPLT